MAEEKGKLLNEELTKRGETLREEMMELEKQFNIKKEEFLKIQVALEAIQALQEES